MSEVIAIIIGGLVGGLLGYILTEITRVNDKAEKQYIQAKLSNMQTNLYLVDYLLRNIGKR